MNCLLKTRCQDGGVCKETRDQRETGAVQVIGRQEEERVTVWDRKTAAIPKLGSSASCPRWAHTENPEDTPKLEGLRSDVL